MRGSLRTGDARIDTTRAASPGIPWAALARDLSWRERARCRRYAPDWSYLDKVFHPVASGSHPSGQRLEIEACRCCLRCEVRRECLRYALRERLVEVGRPRSQEAPGTALGGIWAATTEQEREETAHLPLEQRVAVLEALVRRKAERLLTPDELAEFKRSVGDGE